MIRNEGLSIAHTGDLSMLRNWMHNDIQTIITLVIYGGKIMEATMGEMFRCVYFTYRVVCDGKQGLFICSNRKHEYPAEIICTTGEQKTVNWCSHVIRPCKLRKELENDQSTLEDCDQ